MTVRLAFICGLLVLFVTAYSAAPGNAWAQPGGARAAEKQGDQFVDNDGDGYNDASKPADSSKARKSKWFIDEDGDGISDAAQGRKRGGTGSTGSMQNKPADEGAKQGEAEQNGLQNALQNGLKNGQGKNVGNGLLNALERGRKVGQDSNTDFQTPTTGNKDNVSTGNDKNRFGREYLNNNKNFGNSNNNKGGKGKDPGNKE